MKGTVSPCGSEEGRNESSFPHLVGDGHVCLDVQLLVSSQRSLSGVGAPWMPRKRPHTLFLFLCPSRGHSPSGVHHFPWPPGLEREPMWPSTSSLWASLLKGCAHPHSHRPIAPFEICLGDCELNLLSMGWGEEGLPIRMWLWAI